MTTLNSYKRNVERIYCNAEICACNTTDADEAKFIFEEAKEKISDYLSECYGKTQNKDSQKIMNDYSMEHLKYLDQHLYDLYLEFPDMFD